MLTPLLCSVCTTGGGGACTVDSPVQSWVEHSHYVKSSYSHLSCSGQLFYAFMTVDRMTKPFICQGKKNHPVIFCVLFSERTHSSQHLPNKSPCQEDVDTKGLKEIMEAEIRMKSLPDCQDCAGLLRATPHFSSTKTMQRPSKAAGIQSNTNKMTAVLPVEW